MVESLIEGDVVDFNIIVFVYIVVVNVDRCGVGILIMNDECMKDDYKIDIYKNYYKEMKKCNV